MLGARRILQPFRGYILRNRLFYSTEAVSEYSLHPLLLKRASVLSQELDKLRDKISSGSSFSVADQKRFSELSNLIEIYEKYQQHTKEIQELQEIITSEDEPELKKDAEIEIEELKPELESIAKSLKAKLLPPHPFDEKACILELRPGVGGDEAAIFTKNLLDMYAQFAHHNKFPYHIVSQTPTENNGVTSATILIDEPGSYKLLKYEKGIHRVQRIPDTETKGRVHTSTAAVVVLPKISEDNDNPDADQREFKPDEIRIDVMRSRGKGGQHVNTTDSAVRLTHYPSGIVVSMQDERSQHRNKAKAFAILRARLAEKEHEEKVEREKKLRTSQVTTTDRSDKIRTYNYTQNRITDHRCGFSLHDIDGCMNGTKLHELIEAMEKKDNEDRSKELLESENSA